MLISYFGHSYLHIKGNEYSITLDPYGDVGLKIPKLQSTYAFSSHSHYDHNNLNAVKFNKLVKSSEGFEIISTYHDDNKGKLRGTNDILLFKLDGYKIAFMGDFGESDNKYVIEKLKGVDVLFIPIGGKYTIDSKTAKYYVENIKPKTVIPIHYKIKGLTVDIKDEKEFLKLFDSYIEKTSPYNYNGEDGVVLLSPQMEV